LIYQDQNDPYSCRITCSENSAKEDKMAKSDANKNPAKGDVQEPGRRDFIVVATYAMAGLGAAAVAWPLIDQLNPAADTLALANIEVDISKIAVGQSITVKWRGKPVFIRHRTADEIARANATNLDDLRDPQGDTARAEKPEYLVLVGVCTHLGCVPLGQKTGEVRGDYDGWFCPCHGSHYDTSGRIRKGPAPTNLEVPPYNFLSDSVVRIG
jgi:ubiquinol-cytochrome c reductase iron-sulfur subunit